MFCRHMVVDLGAAQRQIVSDRRRKEAIDEVAHAVTVMILGIPWLAAVQSTILFGILGAQKPGCPRRPAPSTM